MQAAQMNRGKYTVHIKSIYLLCIDTKLRAFCRPHPLLISSSPLHYFVPAQGYHFNNDNQLSYDGIGENMLWEGESKGQHSVCTVYLYMHFLKENVKR